MMRAFIILSLLLLVASAPAPSPSRYPAMDAIPHGAVFSNGNHLEKMSAKRFKRGFHRTAKKVRHFFRRAAGKH